MKLVPEHIDEVMGFQRGIDPKEAIGIGRLADIPSEKIHNAFAIVRHYSLDDLENIFRRVKAKSNISLDGVPIEKLSRNEWIDFHNKIINGIKSLKRRKAKAESPFKEGDIVKADYEGRTYFGVYDGIDKHGRIKAKGHRVKLAFGLDRYTLATPEEERAYKNEGIMIEKRRIESNIKRIKMLLSMGSAKPSDLEEILRKYKSKFGEEYEG